MAEPATGTPGNSARRGLGELADEAGKIVNTVVARGVEQPDEATKKQREQEHWRRNRLGHSLAQCLGRRYSPETTTLNSFVVTREDQAETIARLQILAEKLPTTVDRGESFLFY